MCIRDSLKTAEMINAQIVYKAELVFNPVDPPLIARSAVSLPVIKRIAPELAGGRKIVRRNPGHSQGIALFIELE